MRIIYDNMFEFSQAVIRCTNTVIKGKCSCCPFYDNCQIDLPEDRHIQCGEIDDRAKNEGPCF